MKDFSEVKKRYLELAKTYHPDLCDLKEKKGSLCQTLRYHSRGCIATLKNTPKPLN